MTRDASWLQTYTGKQFMPLSPSPEMVCIEDIAHGLSNLCRFSGQCRELYSVSDHSIHVSEIVYRSSGSAMLSLAGLLHDASEAFVVDVPAPIKPHILGYAEIEAKVMAAIATKFGINHQLFSHPLVRNADLVALATEKRDLMGPEPAPWIDLPPPSDAPLAIRNPAESERVFLLKFKELSQ